MQRAMLRIYGHMGTGFMGAPGSFERAIYTAAKDRIGQLNETVAECEPRELSGLRWDWDASPHGLPMTRPRLTAAQRRCSRCGKTKENAAFPRDSSQASGYKSHCRECHNADRRRPEAKPRQRASGRRSYALHRNEYQERKRANPAEQERLRRKSASPHARARQALNNAVAAGSVVKPECCQQCGVATKLHGHHHRGYDKPLEVEWLCPKCHGLCHRK